jgi:hypothetical protein
MNEKLYDALEVCNKALETGADIEAVLKLYPQMADELRPILETMVKAQSLSVTSVPEDAIRRGRARVLGRAAEMRESTRRSRRVGFAFRRLATSLVLAFVLLVSITGIVNASSGALPGDNLYPIKRTWEDVRLWLTFSPEGREELESEYEQERLDEIDELLVDGREETIAFYGIVTAQDGDYWLVSGVPVQITAGTQLPTDTVSIGIPVTVVGRTNAQGFIEAQMVGALDPGVSLPPLEPSEFEADDSEGNEQGEQPVQEPIESFQGEEDHGDDHEEQPRTFEFRGVVSSQKDGIWIINGQQVDVSQANVIGNITVGSFVKLEGYYAPDGKFIVTKIELRRNNNSDSGSSENSKNDNNNNNDDDHDEKDD